ncbi:PepSY-associated TM helix domain-containing protein [Diaphorobacter aerolatus]|uniref:PepSY-associated TM helix domain-containing protein n=1 Tax=Diaphorobacter aerolatus TaxID=1288495 RepID=A0A7H0GKK6_9BURK|nr:PepSY-associated TM helix domain-containing protein [Diaphorobacter aerolatus]QNP48822.1 PepSY-associated TM helix domain-containing protein [Diaphorobacter aerolatus]
MKSAVSGGSQRAYWLKKLHEWHWISSAICLIGMLLFAITGITLNHAGQIESRPRVESRSAQTPPELLRQLQNLQAGLKNQAKSAASPELPAAAVAFVGKEFKADVSGRAVEWSDEEAYVPLPRPGGDAWLRVGLKDGAMEYESTDRGWISYINDLHKGRHTGGAWSLFLDVFAVGCLVFCVTGLLILKMHSERRPLTWPMVGLGLVIPALLALLLTH